MPGKFINLDFILIFTCWHGEESGSSGLLERKVDGAKHGVAHPHVEHQVVVPGGEGGEDDDKEDAHLSIMAITAETFNIMAFSIASMASAFATGNFKSRSPSLEEVIVSHQMNLR